MMCDVPRRNPGTDGRRHVQYGSQRPLSLHREGYDAGTMTMYDRHDFGSGFEHRSVNKPLGVRFAGRASDRFARGGEFHDIAEFYAIRSACPCEKKMLWPLGIANSDVPKGIEHVMGGENAIGGDEIVLQLAHIDHGFSPRVVGLFISSVAFGNIV